MARSKTLEEFEPHTDASFEKFPPRFVSLYIVQEDECGGGIFSILKLNEIFIDFLLNYWV